MNAPRPESSTDKPKKKKSPAFLTHSQIIQLSLFVNKNKAELKKKPPTLSEARALLKTQFPDVEPSDYTIRHLFKELGLTLRHPRTSNVKGVTQEDFQKLVNIVMVLAMVIDVPATNRTDVDNLIEQLEELRTQ